MRPAREKYLRVARPRNRGGHIEIGLEYRDGDNAHEHREWLREKMRHHDDAAPQSDTAWYTEVVEAEVKVRWPDRAYFFECWDSNTDDSWVQIFQPYGIPRNT